MIDNQQVKYKISIPFFGSLIVCRSYLQPLQAGGVGPKTAARPGRFRGGGPSRISHISRISQYVRRPNIFLCSHPSSPHDLIIPLILLYLRYN